MQVLVKSKHPKVDDALRTHIDERLRRGVEKYFSEAIEVSVIVTQEGRRFRTECSVHVGTGIEVQGHCDADDARASVDGAAEHIEKQLRRLKRRLRDHRHTRSGKLAGAGAAGDADPGVGDSNGSK